MKKLTSAALIVVVTLPIEMPETWCSACASVLGRAVKRHAPSACPLKAASYCGLCACYGHSPATCPETLMQAARSTPVVTPLLPVVVPLQPLLRIPETEDALRAACSAAGVKPMICQEQGKKQKRELTENKKRLLSVTKDTGYTVIFFPEDPAKDFEELPTKPAKAPKKAAAAKVRPVQ